MGEPDRFSVGGGTYRCDRHGKMTGLVCAGCYDEDVATARREERERCARVALHFEGGGDPPCDCITVQGGYWREECDCGNNGDLARASAWCQEMNTRNQIAAAIRALGDGRGEDDGS